MKFSRLIAADVLVTFGLALSSCATIVKGTSESLRVVSDPDSATVTIETMDGITKETKTAPCIFPISTSKDYSIRVQMNGYQTRDIQLIKHLSGWIAGNIVIWWIVGFAVDFIDGAAWEHDTYLKVSLETKTSLLPTDADITAFGPKGEKLAEFLVPLEWEISGAAQ